jgi:hypothetical protein
MHRLLTALFGLACVILFTRFYNDSVWGPVFYLGLLLCVIDILCLIVADNWTIHSKHKSKNNKSRKKPY